MLTAATRRAAFLERIARAPSELAPFVSSGPSHGGFPSERFWITVEGDGERMGGLMLRPIEGVRSPPAIIVLHGTGGAKEEMLPLLERLAASGFVSIAIDARHHGERARGGNSLDSYFAALISAFASPGRAYPFFYDTVWDVIRLVDYLETRADVDATRVGLFGRSKGGTEAYLAAAADGRIAAVVPVLGVQGFGWALTHDAWRPRIATIQQAVDAAAQSEGRAVDAAFVQRFYDRVAPGLASDFDAPQMLPLIAPRPLLVVNGDCDDRTPLTGLERCVDAARQAYKAANAEDAFQLLLQAATGHAFTPAAEDTVVDWFVRRLRP